MYNQLSCEDLKLFFSATVHCWKTAAHQGCCMYVVLHHFTSSGWQLIIHSFIYLHTSIHVSSALSTFGSQGSAGVYPICQGVRDGLGLQITSQSQGLDCFYFACFLLFIIILWNSVEWMEIFISWIIRGTNTVFIIVFIIIKSILWNVSWRKHCQHLKFVCTGMYKDR